MIRVLLLICCLLFIGCGKKDDGWTHIGGKIYVKVITVDGQRFLVTSDRGSAWGDTTTVAMED